MINGKTVVAIVPARGGSKGLPNKNILPLCGKPLVSWTIGAALKSKIIDKCIVTTDSDKIAKIAKNIGAEVPFIRPKYLAEDDSSTDDVLIHTIKSLKERYDILILLQPTSPLRTERDIDGALNSFFDKEAEAMVSVVKKSHPLEWSFRLYNLKLTSFFNEAKKKRRRQDYAPSYELNGAIYISYVKEFLIHMSFFRENTFAYIMPKNKSVDIDDEIDFALAELIMKIEMKL